MLKYTLGRIGLFVVVFAALLPVPMNIWIKLMVAIVFSAGLAFFLFRRWRDEMAEHRDGVATTFAQYTEQMTATAEEIDGEFKQQLQILQSFFDGVLKLSEKNEQLVGNCQDMVATSSAIYHKGSAGVSDSARAGSARSDMLDVLRSTTAASSASAGSAAAGTRALAIGLAPSVTVRRCNGPPSSSSQGSARVPNSCPVAEARQLPVEHAPENDN